MSDEIEHDIALATQLADRYVTGAGPHKQLNEDVRDAMREYAEHMVRRDREQRPSVWRDALTGERPETPHVWSDDGKGKRSLASDVVMYVRRGGGWCPARWTVLTCNDPITAWFPDGGENPIEYVEGDCWTVLPDGLVAMAEGRNDG